MAAAARGGPRCGACGNPHRPADNPRDAAFTKMQGAGNDFVVLDATHAPLDLRPAQLRHLGDRRFGVGADQILVVQRSDAPGVDFRYRIFNGASGAKVEHCGNGARCFLRHVHDRGLPDRTRVRVQTVNNVLELALQPDGRVSVDLKRPRVDPAAVPFDATGLRLREVNGFARWPLPRRRRHAAVRGGGAVRGATHTRCCAWTRPLGACLRGASLW